LAEQAPDSLRFSCAEPADVILEAVDILEGPQSSEKTGPTRLRKARPEFKLDRPYPG